MAWIGGHFAVGMVVGGSAAAGLCAIRRRGWKSVPLAMIVGGIWAVVPDLPRVMRHDLPDGWLTAYLGNRQMGQWLEAHGNWFVLHRWLDTHYAQPWQTNRWGLRGLAMVAVFYTVMCYTLFYANDRLKMSVKQLRSHLAQLGKLQMPVSTQTARQSASMQSDPPAKQRRADPRSPIKLALTGHVLATEHQRQPQPQTQIQLAQAMLADVSASGLALTTRTPVPAGATLKIQPDGASESLQAIVLECLPHGNEQFKLRCASSNLTNPSQFFKLAG